MKKKQWIIIAVLAIIASACSSDDETIVDDGPDGGDPEETLVVQFINSLGASETTFKVNGAEFVTQNGTTLLITENTILKDDELRFTVSDEGNLSVVWNEDSQFNAAANSLNNLFLEGNRAPSQFVFSQIDDNSLSGTSGNRTLLLTVDENLNVSATITFAEKNSVLSASIEEKTSSDYLTPPSILAGSEIFSFEGQSLRSGMKFAASRNSLYFVNREFSETVQFIKYDLSTQSSTKVQYPGLNGFEKHLELFEDKLVSLSQRELMELDYEMVNDPIVTQSNGPDGGEKSFLYHGDMYVVGGFGQLEANTINRLSLETSTFSQVGLLPNEQSYSDGAIYNESLYVFGGWYPSQQGTNYFDDILIYDTSTFTIQEELVMPIEVLDTFTARVQNLIYVGGRAVEEVIDNGNGNTTVITRPFLGVLNAQTNEFTEYDTTNLFPNQYSLRNMTGSSTALFLAVASPGDHNDGQWKTTIYEVPLQ